MNKGHLLILAITTCVVVFLLSKFLLFICVYKIRSRRKRVYQEILSGGRIVLFRLPDKVSLNSQTLLKKTLTLTSKDMIGSGGYGTVYKLTITENLAFAVKKLVRNSTGKDNGFEREINAMGDIKHRNVLTLRGYYKASTMNLLIYDYMQNGSLDNFLYGKSQNIKPLDWDASYKIALGAARGIAYLHHDCIPHIIHRDIKPSNILLDDEMEARIADFGLATLMNPDQTHVSTYVAGTFGYLPPEYVETGKATEKGDVYSFGVVLLELLTRKRPTAEAPGGDGRNMVSWVKMEDVSKCWVNLVDGNLLSSSAIEVDEVKDVFSIACKCLCTDPGERPTMVQVVKMLEHIRTNADSSPV